MINLLLAEKNGVARTAIREVIKSLVDVVLAWDVQEFSDVLLRIEEVHPDVVLLSQDLMMTDLLATLRTIIESSPHTKVLVISMHNDSRFALRTLEAGAAGYMLQDRAFEELENAVKTIMAARTYLSPGIAGLDRTEKTNSIK